MKKYLLALTVALLLFISPVASADKWTVDPNTWKIVVNGQAADKFVLVDGKPYVALDAVGKAFKADVDYNYNTRVIGLNPRPIDPKAIKRPAIKGDKEFTAKINAALDLLEQKDFPDYWMVCMNTWGISQVTKKPEWTTENAAGYSIGGSTLILPRLLNDPKLYVPEYLAGVLVHEACHNTLNNYKKPISKDEETICYAHEYATYRIIGAPQWDAE